MERPTGKEMWGVHERWLHFISFFIHFGFLLKQKSNLLPFYVGSFWIRVRRWRRVGCWNRSLASSMKDWDLTRQRQMSWLLHTTRCASLSSMF